MARIYVGNLSFNTKVNELSAFFEGIELADAKIIETRVGNSRGYGFVTLKNEADTEKALALNNKELDGRPLRIEVAKPEEKKERPAPAQHYPRYQPRYGAPVPNRRYPTYYPYYPPPPRAYYSAPPPPRRERQQPRPAPQPRPQRSTELSKTNVLVKNLNFKVTDEEFKKLFEPYNPVEASISYNRKGSSKGYGFVILRSEDDQARVIKELNDFEHEGRKLIVIPAYVRDQTKTD